jgi:hypothetical protein
MKPRSNKPKSTAPKTAAPKPKHEAREEFIYEPYQQKSPLQVDPQVVKDLEADGFSLQWSAVECAGMPIRDSYIEQNGWSPVLRSDWGGILSKHAEGDGPPDSPIMRGGLMLVARPVEIHRKAKQFEKAQAAEKLDNVAAMVNGGMPGVTGSRHKSALGYNRANRTVERITIAEDE